MKRLAEKARAQNAAAGDGETHAPSSTKGFAMATQKRREELQAKQRAEEKAAKEKEKYAAQMSKKKPASELLGVVARGEKNNNLAMLKVTQAQVKALQKIGEKPDMYLTDDQKRLLEENELKEKLKAKVPGASLAKTK